jgi:alpha-1,2-mannosyltransferase
MRALPREGRARLASVVALGTLLGLALSHVVGRFWWNEIVFALNGWYTPFDLAVFLDAGEDVLAGQSPYPDPATFHGDDNYVYPPTLALLMTPLSAFPERYSDTLYMLASIAAIPLALRLLGVRDWRCYVLALFFPFVQDSLRLGTLGPFLILLLALVWRYRNSAAVAGIALGLAVVLKLFLWPFALWLIVTRRFRAMLVAFGTGVGLALASWAVIGFAGLGDYARLLELLADEEAESSYSLVAVGHLFGLPYGAASVVALAMGAVLLVIAGRAARWRDRSPFERDRASFVLVLAASLALTPIVWLHYLSVLIVPIALARPRLSAMWFLPLALWPMFWLDEYRGWPNGDIDAIAAALGLAVAVFAFSAVTRQQRRSTSRLV